MALTFQILLLKLFYISKISIHLLLDGNKEIRNFAFLSSLNFYTVRSMCWFVHLMWDYLEYSPFSIIMELSDLWNNQNISSSIWKILKGKHQEEKWDKRISDERTFRDRICLLKLEISNGGNCINLANETVLDKYYPVSCKHWQVMSEGGNWWSPIAS